MAGRPLEAMALIGLGYRSISMAPASVGPVKSMILSLDAGARALDAAQIRPARATCAPSSSASPRSRASKSSDAARRQERVLTTRRFARNIPGGEQLAFVMRMRLPRQSGPITLRGRAPRRARTHRRRMRPPAWRDPQLGQIFRNMRLAMRLSRETIARRLATTPPPSTTSRRAPVRAAALEGDGPDRAQLLRAAAGRSRADPVAHPKPADARRQARPAAAVAARARRVRRRPPLRKRGATRSRPPSRRAAPGARAVCLQRAGRSCCRRSTWRTRRRAGLSRHRVLPDRGYGARGHGLSGAPTAPRREGLRWIEVGDPRLRKADKLQTSSR